MQMGPKSGKLSRSNTNPYSNVILKPCKESPTFRVKQSTLLNMRSNFESSVGINNFNDPNADDDRLLIEDHAASNGSRLAALSTKSWAVVSHRSPGSRPQAWRHRKVVVPHSRSRLVAPQLLPP